MIKYIKYVILLLFLFCTLNLSAECNPFFNSNSTEISGKTQENDNKSYTQNKPAFIFLGKYYRSLAKLQNKINKYITRITNQIKYNSTFKLFAIILILGFCYGLIHTLGPGHGKIFAVSFLISRKSRIIDGLFLGFGIAVLHVLSATILTISLYFILKFSVLSITGNLEAILQKISYGLITLVGLGVLYFHLGTLVSRKKEIKPIEYSSKRGLIAMALSVGLVPCPCIIIVLLFFISQGLLYFGLFLVLFITLGMVTVISTFGVLAINLKSGSYLSLKNHIKDESRFENILGVIGGSLIIMFGSILFLSYYN